MWELVEAYDISYELGKDNLVEFNCDACGKVPTVLNQYINESNTASIYVCDNETCLNIAILQQE